MSYHIGMVISCHALLLKSCVRCKIWNCLHSSPVATITRPGAHSGRSCILRAVCVSLCRGHMASSYYVGRRPSRFLLFSIRLRAILKRPAIFGITSRHCHSMSILTIAKTVRVKLRSCSTSFIEVSTHVFCS